MTKQKPIKLDSYEFYVRSGSYKEIATRNGNSIMVEAINHIVDNNLEQYVVQELERASLTLEDMEDILSDEKRFDDLMTKAVRQSHIDRKSPYHFTDHLKANYTIGLVYYIQVLVDNVYQPYSIDFETLEEFFEEEDYTPNEKKLELFIEGFLMLEPKTFLESLKENNNFGMDYPTI